MPTNDNYVFDKGASLTPTLGPLASVFEQTVERATPNSYRGAVIYDAATPTTVGEPSGYPTNWYTWQKRCLWIKPATQELFVFDGTTWVLGKAKPADASVSTATLIDKSVTIGKLSPTGAAQFQIPRVNSAVSAVEWVNAADLFNAGDLSIDKLSGSGVGSFVLTRNGSAKAWTQFDSATILALIGSNEIPLDYITRGSALQVPMVNAGGTALIWSSIVGAIADKSLPISKLAPSVPDAGKYFRRNPTTGEVESVPLNLPTTPNIQIRVDEITTLPAAGAAASSAHGLAAIPSMVTGYLVCVNADAGYAVGDVVDLDAIATTGIPGSYNYAGGFFISFDATNVTITANDATTRKILNRSTGAQHTFVAANWKFRYTAVRYY